MTLVDEFMVAFGVWEVTRPYVHMIVDEREMELIFCNSPPGEIPWTVKEMYQ